MAVVNPESKQRLNVMILEGDSDDEVSIPREVEQIVERRIHYQRHNSAGSALDDLRENAYDLLLFEEQFSRLMDNSDFWQTYTTVAGSPTLVLLTTRLAEHNRTRWPQTAVDLAIARERINGQFLAELLSSGKPGSSAEEMSEDLKTSTHDRSFLSNYLNSVLNTSGPTDFSWVLVFLNLGEKLAESMSEAPEQPERFYEGVTQSVNSESMIDKKLGRYDRNVFWGLFACLSSPRRLKQTVAQSLMELRNRSKSGGRSDSGECNAVVQRIQSRAVNHEEVFRNIKRSLDRVSITPGPSVVYQTFG